jgi:tetratricopeptide (TPR) repeat protein
VWQSQTKKVLNILNGIATFRFTPLAMTLFLLILNTNSFAQETLTFTNVDKQTYDYYIAKDWYNLTSVGEKALEQNIDYFYLRMRLGIAQYELKQYDKSTENFKKALEFNNGDELTLEYLYFSYIYSEKYAEAEQLSTNFSKELKNKIGIVEPKFVHSVEFESAFSQNLDFEKNKTISIKPPNQLLSERNILKNQFNNTLALTLNLSKRISFSTAFTKIQINNFQTVKSYENSINDVGNFKTSENLIYGRLNFHSKKQSNFYVAFNMAFVKATNLGITDLVINNNNSIDVYIDKPEINYKDYVALIGFEKTKKSLTQTKTFSYSKIDSLNQFQISYSLLNYFGKKKKTYFSIKSTLFSELSQKSTMGNGKGKMSSFGVKILLEPALGTQIGKIWLGTFATIGTLQNYTEKDAAIINNSPNAIKFRTGISAFIPITKHFSITLKTLFTKNEGNIKVTLDDLSNTYQAYRYNFLFCIANLKYTF